MDGGRGREKRNPKDRTRAIPLEVCILAFSFIESECRTFGLFLNFHFSSTPSSPWPIWSPRPTRRPTAQTRCGSGTEGTLQRDGLTSVLGELVLRFVHFIHFVACEVCTKLDCLRTDSSSPTTRARSAATSTLSSTTETSNSSHNSWRTTQEGCSRRRAQGSASISGFREEWEHLKFMHLKIFN